MMVKIVWVKESDLMMYKLFNKYIYKIFVGVYVDVFYIVLRFFRFSKKKTKRMVIWKILNDCN